MKGLAAALLLFTALSAGSGCSRPEGDRLNVVLVSVDTLRPDRLGSYGAERDTSPVMDRLAAEGTRFETVVSTTTWTLPAHHALLTSLPDTVHGVLWDDRRLDGNRVTLAEMFHDAGYRTGGIFTGPYLLPRFGFDQGFDDYLDGTLYDKKLRGPDVLVASEQGQTTPGAMDMVEAWLDEDQEKPFFLFLHLFDVHPDFDPPPPYDRLFDPGYEGTVEGKDVFHNPDIHPGMDRRDLDHLMALYDSEIRYVDEEGIGRLVAALGKRGLLDTTLLVITSDHGEEFFEHGRFGHRNNLYDTTLKVPLIFRGPGSVPKGLVVRRPAALIDIMPTILELAGLPGSPEAMGRSLVGAMNGRENPPSPGISSELTGGSLHLESYREERGKVVLDFNEKAAEYFDLETDPGEKHPVTDPDNGQLAGAVGRFKQAREAMALAKRSLPRGTGKGVDIDDEMRQRLESLGYVDR